ncbi:MAG: taurine dioxygenase [Rhodospirillaceae bacterium]|jgi:taurine dioxygenase|nr:taurine dioxygenase [Rhodospirillaceae bacterium]
MAYKSIDVQPVSGALGAEVLGADLTQDLDNETWDDIHQAFLDHIVLIFRDQDLSIERHKEVGRRFGPLHLHPLVKTKIPEHPEILLVEKEADEKVAAGGVWHSDVSFGQEPPLGSLLYAEVLPPYGGDTMWANQYLAYETLSDGMKAMLEGLNALHGMTSYWQKDGPRHGDQKRTVNIDFDKVAAMEPAVHPIVRTHPETGRKALYINPAFTMHIEGMTEEESKPILDYLYKHSTRPEFTCRLRWSPGTLGIWDNRCTMHLPINDYAGHRRRMRRVTVQGDRPH